MKRTLVEEIKWDLSYPEEHAVAFLQRRGELIAKYSEIKFDVDKKIAKLEIDLSKRYKEILEHYKLEYEISLSPAQIDKLVKGDEKYAALYEEYAKRKGESELLRNVLDYLKSAGYDAAKIIETEKVFLYGT